MTTFILPCLLTLTVSTICSAYTVHIASSVHSCGMPVCQMIGRMSPKTISGPAVKLSSNINVIVSPKLAVANNEEFREIYVVL